MSRYDQLAAQAGQLLLTLNRQEAECRDVALALVWGYAKYLDCPVDALKYVRVNSDLEPVGEQEPFSPALDLTAAADGYRYFAYRLTLNPPATLEWVQETVCLGVNVVDGIQMVRHAERTFERSAADTWEVFFKYLFDGTCSWLSASPRARQRTIGFHGS